MRTTFLILLMTFSVGALAQGKSKTLDQFFKEKTKIENPLELRDPFKAPLFKGEASEKKWNKGGKGMYSNITDVNLEAVQTHEMKVVGVLIGKERRVLIRGKDQDKGVLILKEGMKIGPEQAELKAILPGGIVLVEKIINVYGQEEYLETVIPISR